ncbi:MAG: hypothetical protein H0T92_05775 [Pyrinomonadaceae bacterium]|nr:hypothetical protein [Pyrinomonadaceae bacterium]
MRGVSRFRGVMVTLLVVFCAANIAEAQSLKARIQIVSLDPPRIRIEGEQPVSRLSFRDSYAGVMNIAARIENVTFADMSGADVPVRKIASGEYQAARRATTFRYEVRLNPPTPPTDAAHISWLAGEHGLLMLGDLLPKVRTNVKVSFTLPTNWFVGSVVREDEAGQFDITDADEAVFFVGQDLREQRTRIKSTEFKMIAAGKWAFVDEDVLNTASDILKQCREAAGSPPGHQAMLILAPFPQPVPPHRWSAETRGSTVIFLAGQAASKHEALARLSVPLAHELFHLWVPNKLALDGQYDWFYEGFTLYQAMRMSMRLGQLFFHDYLNAMGRAFDGYLSASHREKISLLDASRQRWNGNAALVYNKGMLVAFLYDLTLRQQTKGKRSLDDVYRNLFRRHATESRRTEGNSAVLEALNSESGMREITRRYIENVDVIELEKIITLFGLRAERPGAQTRIAVAEPLDRRQRELLKQFGYDVRASSVLKERTE